MGLSVRGPGAWPCAPRPRAGAIAPLAYGLGAACSTLMSRASPGLSVRPQARQTVWSPLVRQAPWAQSPQLLQVALGSPGLSQSTGGAAVEPVAGGAPQEHLHLVAVGHLAGAGDVEAGGGDHQGGDVAEGRGKVVVAHRGRDRAGIAARAGAGRLEGSDELLIAVAAHGAALGLAAIGAGVALGQLAAGGVGLGLAADLLGRVVLTVEGTVLLGDGELGGIAGDGAAGRGPAATLGRDGVVDVSQPQPQRQYHRLMGPPR